MGPGTTRAPHHRRKTDAGHNHQVEPCTLVIFGASGDLTHRKLVPALYNLALDHLLPSSFNVIGFARRPKTDEEFRADMRGAVAQFSRRRPVDDEVWNTFAGGLHYVQSSFEDTNGYRAVKEILERLDREQGAGNRRLFYLAVPPCEELEIVKQLGAAGLQNGGSGGWTRIVLEKPFGRDLASARALNGELSQVFEEDQVYRIDHYLGKETVQNILVFRFSNGIFEPIWNRRYINNVQITVAENLGMENRGGYYEQAGAVRDIVQNHMLQVLCMVGMEPPTTFDATALRNEKVKLLRSLHPIAREAVESHVVRGQYGPGVIDGHPMPAYRNEPGVPVDSNVETFVAMKLFIENWRWAGVPFYLRHGKALAKRITEVAIEFRRAPHLLFSRASVPELEPNVLKVRIQPNEGISLRFGAKTPGNPMRIKSVDMDFEYSDAFSTAAPEAYETLILDCMEGDATLFMRWDEVEAAWEFVTPILEAWAAKPPPDFPNYGAGTWGPRAADDLIRRDGCHWQTT